MIFIIKFLPVALMKSHTPTHITIRNIKITKDYILKISDKKKSAFFKHCFLFLYILFIKSAINQSY